MTITVLMNRSHGRPHVIADKLAALYIPALRRALRVPPSAATILKTPIYIQLTMTDGRAMSPLRSNEPGLFEATLPLMQGMNEFRILSEDEKTISFGAFTDELVIRPDELKNLEFEGEDFFMQLDAPGRYTFKFDARKARKPTLVVRAQTTPTR